jgi:tripartite-type tricarboxylate transporter receptor subunit TctC
MKIITGIAAALSLAAGGACAQDFPTRPVRLIAGSPGSTSDFSARYIAQKLGARYRKLAEEISAARRLRVAFYSLLDLRLSKSGGRNAI